MKKYNLCFRASKAMNPRHGIEFHIDRLLIFKDGNKHVVRDTSCNETIYEGSLPSCNAFVNGIVYGAEVARADFASIF